MKSASNKTLPSTFSEDKMTNYEPTPEDVEAFSKLDAGYIGYAKPKVTYITEKLYLEEPDFDPCFDIDLE